ncbi:MAG: sugar MFS transporter [Bacteroidales bacterium]
MKKEIRKTNVLIAGFTGMIFFGVAFVIMGAVLPSLIKEFSLDTTAASTLVGLLPLGILLGSVLFGPVIDRFGYKKLIIFSSIITVAGLELLAFMNTIPTIRFSIFLIGLGGGILNGLTNALVSDISDDKNRASNLSILGVFYTIGAIIIPLLFATLSKSISYQTIVSVAGIIMAISLIYYFAIEFPDAKFKQGFPLKRVLSMAKEPVILLLSFVLFFQSGLEGICNNWIPTYLESEKGIDAQKAMLALSALIVGIGTGRLLLGYLLRIVAKEMVLLTSVAIAAAGIVVIHLFPAVTPAMVGSFMLGLGFASTFPVVLGDIGERYKEISGTAFSFALVIALTGNTLINLFIGYISLEYFHLTVIAGAGAIAILFIMAMQVAKREKKIKSTN